jgi:outer membrane protein OmpA-like peptidoglycan-associated protein
MFEEDDREIGFALFLVIALAIIVAIGTIGIAAGTAISQAGGTTTSTPKASSITRVYFEPGKAELPADSASSLTPYVVAAKDKRRTVVVSGFHDPSGDAAANEELAKQRAFAVRDFLVRAGVPAERVELRKPVVTTGGGDPQEARRVEVTLR